VTSDSFYDAIGGHDTFRRLVARFYAGVATDPALRPMYPEEDLGPAEERLLMYQEQRGHPRLRMRHSPYQIDEAARDAWLGHMRDAVDELKLPPEHDDQLWEYLIMAAFGMQNTE
jgi:hemoglobin